MKLKTEGGEQRRSGYSWKEGLIDWIRMIDFMDTCSTVGTYVHDTNINDDDVSRLRFW